MGWNWRESVGRVFVVGVRGVTSNLAPRSGGACLMQLLFGFCSLCTCVIAVASTKMWLVVCGFS